MSSTSSYSSWIQHSFCVINPRDNFRATRGSWVPPTVPRGWNGINEEIILTAYTMWTMRGINSSVKLIGIVVRFLSFSFHCEPSIGRGERELEGWILKDSFERENKLCNCCQWTVWNLIIVLALISPAADAAWRTTDPWLTKEGRRSKKTINEK